MSEIDKEKEQLKRENTILVQLLEKRVMERLEVSLISLNGNEKLCVYVDVEDLPPGAALSYMRQVRDIVKNKFHDINPILFVPVRHGTPTAEFKVEPIDEN
jgi:hypothetical protein